jgi:hypothetical protein
VDRQAVQDAIIPLTDSLTTLNGNRVSEVSVRKGQIVTFAIASYQRCGLSPIQGYWTDEGLIQLYRLESRWGADAHEFNPSRWLDGTPYKGEALGPYANLSVHFWGSVVAVF